jgi:hypothetical protein
MNVTDAPSGILDPQQPYWPADKVSDRIWLKLKGKLTGRPIAELGGEQYTSYVRLSEADADRLIENIKKYGQYPQVNQNDKYGGAYNNEQYQKWLVEEFLEKPFSAQVDEKIADAAIQSRLKEIQEKKEKAQSFISSSTRFGFGSSTSIQTRIPGVIPKSSIPDSVITFTPNSPEVTPEVTAKEKAQSFISSSGSSSAKFGGGSKKSIQTRIPGVIPKRSIPTEVTTSTPKSPEIDPSGSEATFGRLLLNFVQINNDLEAIKEVIEEDFKTTKEKNKQEVDEYKKRVANRGRKLTKKELGSDKKSVTETIKPFISNFFSGAGGAIRSLALLKMLLGILNGDISAVFKGLFGIGLSFLPKIGMMIAGGILKNLLASMAGRAVGAGVSRGVGGGAMRRAPIAAPSSGIGKWAKIASLGTGALALGSALSISKQDQQSTSTQQQSTSTQQQSTSTQQPVSVQQESETQKRLEELTAQQKSSPETSSIPQEDIKKFEQLNIKFEKALEFFIETYKKTMDAKQKERASSSASSPSAAPGPTGPVISSSPGEANLAAFVSTLESSGIQDQSDVLQSMVNRAGQNYSGYGGLFGQLTASNQYSPLSAAIHGTTDPAAQAKYGPVAAKLGRTPQERIAKLQEIISKPDALSQLQTLFGAGNAGAAKTLLDDFYSRGPLSKESQRLIRGRTNFGARSGVGGATGSDQIRRSSNTFGAAGANVAPSLLPSVVPSAPALPPSPVQPTPRPAGRRASALSGSGSQPMVAVNVVPVSSNKPQAVTPNSGTNLPSIDPNYGGDRFSLLTAGELNLVGALG